MRTCVWMVYCAMVNVKQSLNLHLLSLETIKPRLCSSVGCVCLVCVSYQYVVGLDVPVHAVVAVHVGQRPQHVLGHVRDVTLLFHQKRQGTR